MMTSYICFKSLRVCPDGLYSPRYPARWDEVYDPLFGLTHSLSVPKDALEQGGGIYAAAPGEAMRYLDDDCQLFVVAPHPDAKETELGTKGWRTTHAVVIGRVDRLYDAASLVVSSDRAGYSQVEGVLEWAKTFIAMLDSLPKGEQLPVHELVERFLPVRRLVRAAAMGQYAEIRRGRSENTAGVTWSTPIKVVPGDSLPTLEGLPYLKTTFTRGKFARVLYTPSTLRIEVGEEWLKHCLFPKQKCVEVKQ